MTDKQKQNLLAFLGYYVGEIDGIFGQMSQTATKSFQADYGLEVTGVVDQGTEGALKHAVTHGMPVKKSFWDDTKYFKRDEFKCKCGKYCNGFPAEPEEKLVRLADLVREHFGAPAIVSSGVRCETHNANVGGAIASRHLSGKAMDFTVRGKTAQDVLEFVQSRQEVRYAYAIDSNYIHMDVIL